ncbi:MAG: hypothetical protein AMS27_12030 [Bacteroides sp. SM23_62_1]|nr:MAG: hypothetical protein AMS27_12030 [Bacteroides sp. SM23_62_1]
MENPKSGWNRLSTIGGLAAIIFLVYSVVTMLLLITIGGQPSTIEECFSLLQNNRFIGLLRLDILTFFIVPFYYLLFLGFWVSLRKIHIAYTTLATVIAFAGITLFLSDFSIFQLISVSDKYGNATTEAQKLQLLSAGEMILHSGLWTSSGIILGGILLQIAFVLISIVMLWSNVFSKLTGYVGIATHGLDLMHILIAFFLPKLGVILMVIAGPLYLLWFPLVGFRLLRLGRDEKEECSE